MTDKEIIIQLKEIKRALICKSDVSSGGNVDSCCPETNTLLTDIKELLSLIPIDETFDTFQILDCEGLPIGTPQNIKKTIVLNKTTTKVCNVQELADAINAGLPTVINYNSEEELIITPDSTYTIAPNTVHAYSVSVTGTGTTSTISINGAVAIPITDGYLKQVQFTTTNAFSIEIFCDLNDVIIIGKQY